MNKYVILILLSLLSMRVQAGTTIAWNSAGCTSVGGVWIEAHASTDDGCDADHCNSKEFCRSPVVMNWWSAFAWCESIGARLASADSACPNGFSSKTCANLKGKLADRTYINMPAGSTTAWHITKTGEWSTGDRALRGSGNNWTCYALCEK